MHVGITATRNGINNIQISVLYSLLRSIKKKKHLYDINESKVSWLHHGDCIGGDAKAHEVALIAKYKIHIHPPENDKLRAFCKGYHVIDNAKPYMERNWDIVRDSECLVTLPDSTIEKRMSGTWATWRIAAKIKKPSIIIFPNGDLKYTDNSFWERFVNVR